MFVSGPKREELKTSDSLQLAFIKYVLLFCLFLGETVGLFSQEVSELGAVFRARSPNESLNPAECL